MGGGFGVAVDIFVMRCTCMSGSAQGLLVGRLSFRVHSYRVGIEEEFTYLLSITNALA